MTDSTTDAVPAGVARRTALKKGVAVGGAALWAVPAVQVIGMSVAHAEDTSPVPPPGGGETPQEPTGTYISHGFVLVLSGGKYYSVKIENDGSVDGSGNQDRDYLAGLGYKDIKRGVPAGFVGSLTAYQGELALKLEVPASSSLVEAVAVSYDGSFDDDQDGPEDKFAPATVVGRTVYFRVSDDEN